MVDLIVSLSVEDSVLLAKQNEHSFSKIRIWDELHESAEIHVNINNRIWFHAAWRLTWLEQNVANKKVTFQHSSNTPSPLHGFVLLDVAISSKIRSISTHQSKTPLKNLLN